MTDKTIKTIIAEQGQVIYAMNTLIDAIQSTPIAEFEQWHLDTIKSSLSTSNLLLILHQSELLDAG